MSFDIFYGHLVYIFCGHLVFFPHFGLLYVCTKKYLATLQVETINWLRVERNFPILFSGLKALFLARTKKEDTKAGLPDGLFSNQKSQFG
jgi:hypothetical protein